MFAQTHTRSTTPRKSRVVYSIYLFVRHQRRLLLLLVVFAPTTVYQHNWPRKTLHIHTHTAAQNYENRARRTKKSQHHTSARNDRKCERELTARPCCCPCRWRRRRQRLCRHRCVHCGHSLYQCFPIKYNKAKQLPGSDSMSLVCHTSH